jgi:1-deoxy-D-xylulose-5-phosphate reductoisomerase
MSPSSPPRLRRIAILGATGSIGTAAVNVISHLAKTDTEMRWQLYGVSGHHNLRRLAEIAVELGPHRIVLSDPEGAKCGQSPCDRSKRIVFPQTCRIDVGHEALNDLAADPDVDIVVASIVGRAGLESTLAAVQAGKRVAIANKETLVVAGGLVQSAARQSGAELLPVDSEHSAIFQCLAGGSIARRIILTASGGPFRLWTTEQMQQATVEQALAHPTWQMGRKISVDSATMMNKALEIIEARWLFDCPAEMIEVMVHPQSIIHSMVEMIDGSTIAQLSPPDMRLPIQHALTYPRCLAGDTPRLDLTRTSEWTLTPADATRFPAISLGFEVARVGGTAGAVVNAANEEAVGLFLDRRIRFTDIVAACRIALENHNHEQSASLDRLLELDRWARAEVQRWQARSNS